MQRCPKVVFLLGLTLLLPGLVCAESTDTATDWKALAAHWAPMVVQSTRYDFKVDVISSFDADGDMDATNNRGVAVRVMHDSPSVLYYWAMGSKSHWYIGYGLYYAHGVMWTGKVNHTYANDMHGVVLAIRRSADTPMGKFVALTTWGRGTSDVYVEQSNIAAGHPLRDTWSLSIDRFDPAQDGVRDIDFVIDSLGVHPVIYAEAGFHAVFGEKEQTGILVGPRVFEVDELVDWRWIQTVIEGGEEELLSRYHRPGNSKISGGGGHVGVPVDDGLLYRYEGTAMPVISTRSRGRGTVIHHWNLVAYDLRPIDPLWALRLDHEKDPKLTFVRYGEFAGSGTPGPASRAPWAWGSVFFDPAGHFASMLKGHQTSVVTLTSFAPADELQREYQALGQ